MRRPPPDRTERPRTSRALLLGLVGVLLVLPQVDLGSRPAASLLLLAIGLGFGLQPLLFTRGRVRGGTASARSNDGPNPERAASAAWSPFALRSTLTEVVLACAPGADAAGLALTLHVDGRLPDSFLGEMEPIAAVLDALVANALAATETGGVRVEVRLAEPASGCTVVIEVEDTGAGLSADQLTEVFATRSEARPPYAADDAAASYGPARCREAVLALGGSLRVRSKVGCGSTFRVELPLVPEPGAALPSRAQAGTPERAAA